MSKPDKGLFICLVVAMVAALGCLGYVLAVPSEGERFTEFYILDAEGEAGDYPKLVVLGDPIDIVIGVVNHEHRPASYWVEITIDGVEKRRVNIGTLAHEEKREEEVSFIPQVAGERKRVEFHLYKNGEAEPHHKEPLYFHIDVISP